MEALTRLVADSLARHGLDRPVDPRRLQWSRWFRCDSPHSLLIVPSKPGIFALAEEVMNLGPTDTHGGTDAFVRSAEQNSAAVSSSTRSSASSTVREGHDFSRAANQVSGSAALAAGSPLGGAALQRYDSSPAQNSDLADEAPVRRMLAVLQFAEDDDMAFVLDRMFTRINPMRERLASGRCFLRFVVIEDQSQRRTICAALNQWMLNSAEKASGLPADFSSSLEFVAPTSPEREPKGPSPAIAVAHTNSSVPANGTKASLVGMARNLDSGAVKNLHCPHPLPSGF